MHVSNANALACDQARIDVDLEQQRFFDLAENGLVLGLTEPFFTT